MSAVQNSNDIVMLRYTRASPVPTSDRTSALTGVILGVGLGLPLWALIVASGQVMFGWF